MGKPKPTMIHLLRLEAIGDNIAAENRLYQETLRTAGVPHGIRDLCDAKWPRPWVAQIVGLCPRWLFQRDFLRANKDYSLANSVGSRGVFYYYHLRDGKVYEVNDLESWGSQVRYFCRIEEGKRVKVSESEVVEWLK